MEVVPAQQKATKYINGVPEAYFTNQKLNKAIGCLPSHYNFQIPKTLFRIHQLQTQLNKPKLNISLQFPEGLMMFGCIISDILRAFSGSQVVILGDVTYGACCVDDIASDRLDIDLLVHYGHSCLVPITQTLRKVLYVFVQINIDVSHFIETFELNFAEKDALYYLLATIQFNGALYEARQILADKGYTNLVIPQEKPRSGGEVLGCTSPVLPSNEKGKNLVVFLCDGRFHMESTMIANPQFDFFQYNPYPRQLTIQKYANQEMMRRRQQEMARAMIQNTKAICFIFGTLGRQGNQGILDRMAEKVPKDYRYFVLLASEVNQVLLKSLESSVDFYVQISCPRLSIDWGYKSPKPLLTPYEFFVVIKEFEWRAVYPMDYYSNNGGPWSNYFGKQPKKGAKVKLTVDKQKAKG